MRDFLLDTQTIRYWYDTRCSQHAAVIGNISAIRSMGGRSEVTPKLLISVITLGEIEFGHRVASTPDPVAQAEYVQFVTVELPDAFDLTRDTVEAYGELRSRLFNKCAPAEKRRPKMRPEQLIDPATARELQIQENDLWLCAQAIAHGLVFVTNDRMRTIRDVVPGMNPPLFTQNWTIAGTAAIPD